MKERREYILRNEKVFVGVDDSKKTWSLCIRSEGIIVHETSMPAQYGVLRNYFNNKFPKCQIEVMYEFLSIGHTMSGSSCSELSYLVRIGWKSICRGL